MPSPHPENSCYCSKREDFFMLSSESSRAKLASSILNFVTPCSEPKCWLEPSKSSRWEPSEKIFSSFHSHSPDSSSIRKGFWLAWFGSRISHHLSLFLSSIPETILNILGSDLQNMFRDQLSSILPEVLISDQEIFLAFTRLISSKRRHYISSFSSLISHFGEQPYESLLLDSLSLVLSGWLLYVIDLDEFGSSSLSTSSSLLSEFFRCFLFLQLLRKSCIFMTMALRCSSDSQLSSLSELLLIDKTATLARIYLARVTASSFVRRIFLLQLPSTTAISLLRKSVSNSLMLLNYFRFLRCVRYRFTFVKTLLTPEQKKFLTALSVRPGRCSAI